MKKLNTPLGRWLQSKELTIVELQEDLALAYRTVWLATHGYRVSYETAVKISSYTNDKVSVKSLCEAKPRSELAPQG